MIGVMPGILASFLYGLSSIPQSSLDTVLVISFLYNLSEVLLKLYAFGGPAYNNYCELIFSCWKLLFNLRYFKFDKYPEPPLVEASIFRWRQMYNLPDSTKFIYLPHNDWKWAVNTLAIVRPLSLWDRKQLAMVNKFDFFLVFVSLIGAVYCRFIGGEEAQQYQRMWLEVPLLRLFTVVITNRRLVFVIVTVVHNFLSLLCVAGLYIIIWARIGVTLFHNKSEIVTPEIYDVSTEANFDNLNQGVLALLQLMVGEGWHEVMYLNVLATGFSAVYYFIIYIIIVTLFISNIFIGMVLAGIDDLRNQRANDDIIAKCMDAQEQEFYSSALERKKFLEKQIDKWQLQVNRINTLLQLRDMKAADNLNSMEDDIINGFDNDVDFAGFGDSNNHNHDNDNLHEHTHSTRNGRLSSLIPHRTHNPNSAIYENLGLTSTRTHIQHRPNSSSIANRNHHTNTQHQGHNLFEFDNANASNTGHGRLSRHNSYGNLHGNGSENTTLRSSYQRDSRYAYKD